MEQNIKPNAKPKICADCKWLVWDSLAPAKPPMHLCRNPEAIGFYEKVDLVTGKHMPNHRRPASAAVQRNSLESEGYCGHKGKYWEPPPAAAATDAVAAEANSSTPTT